MLHLALAPNWNVEPHIGAGVLWFIIPALVCCAVFFVALIIVNRRDSDLSIRQQVFLAAPLALAAVLMITGLVTVFTTGANSEATQRTEVASWLRTEYAVTVNPDDLHNTRDNPNLVTVTGSIHGRLTVIKLMPSPDGRVAAFTSDDKPLASTDR